MGTANRGLLLFDLASAVPQDAKVLSATLQFEVVFEPQTPQIQSGIFSLHQMLTDWGEGTQAPANPIAPGLGAPALPGEATWNTPFFGSDASWGAPGGLADVDFVAIASATTVIEDLDLYQFDSLPRVIGDVQTWVANPDENYGWMMKALFEEDRYTARRLGAREDLFASPILTVTFEPVPEPGTLGVLAGALGCLAWALRTSRRA